MPWCPFKNEAYRPESEQIFLKVLTEKRSRSSWQRSSTKFMSVSLGKTASLISSEKGILACPNQAQWYGSTTNKQKNHKVLINVTFNISY